MRLFTIAALSLLVSLPLTAAYSPVEEANKKTVQDFMELTFNKHKPEEALKKFVGDKLTSHSLVVNEGKENFVLFFKDLFKKNPKSRVNIKRILVDNDFVVVRAHTQAHKNDPGAMLMLTLRLENGKIVETWDTFQAIPDKFPNVDKIF